MPQHVHHVYLFVDAIFVLGRATPDDFRRQFLRGSFIDDLVNDTKSTLPQFVQDFVTGFEQFARFYFDDARFEGGA